MGPVPAHPSPKALYGPPFAPIKFPGKFSEPKTGPPLIFAGIRWKISQDKKAGLALWVTAPYSGRELSWFIEAMRPVAKAPGPPIPFRGAILIE